jgi:peptide deformylase
MILPIVAFGDSVLKKKAAAIDKNYPNLQTIIADMFETMYNADGVGLAAPQVGLSIRLFIVDANHFQDEEEELKDFKKVFINAQLMDENGDDWQFNEGCLSIPGIREDILRKPVIHLSYEDENFNSIKQTFTGMAARIIQHEYDHIEGKLFVDYLTPLKKRLLKGKLKDISIGKVDVDYKMRFPVKR